MRPTRTSAAVAMTSLALLSLPPVAAAAATPGSGSAGTGSEATGGVVVNEFAPSVPFWPVDEFVELRNTGAQTVALDGWDLVACLSPTTFQVATTFPASAVIPPGGYLLLTHPDWANASGSLPDYHYDVDVPEDGGWLLRDPWSGYADGVGLSGGLVCTEGDHAPQCDWAGGEAVTRDDLGRDTDDNRADFTTCKARTPGG